MTHEEKAIAIAYARGVMDVLSVMVRAVMVGDDKDKDKLDGIVAYATFRLRDALGLVEDDDGEEAE